MPTAATAGEQVLWRTEEGAGPRAQAVRAIAAVNMAGGERRAAAKHKQLALSQAKDRRRMQEVIDDGTSKKQSQIYGRLQERFDRRIAKRHVTPQRCLSSSEPASLCDIVHRRPFLLC